MMPTIVSALRRAAFFLRQIGALGVLVLSVRILWLSAQAGIAQAKSSSAATVPAPEQKPRAQVGQNPHRPNLEDLQTLISKESQSKPEESAPPPAPTPIQRRILVDVGPARSEVFVGKKNVGMTPYGGQIACILGEEIKIQVLPPRGVPILRRVTCRGDTLLVQD